jgi:hypothetical protein
MIGLGLLLSAAAPQTAIDAERAFAAMGKPKGNGRVSCLRRAGRYNVRS